VSSPGSSAGVTSEGVTQRRHDVTTEDAHDVTSEDAHDATYDVTSEDAHDATHDVTQDVDATSGATVPPVTEDRSGSGRRPRRRTLPQGLPTPGPSTLGAPDGAG
jgi:hypothetical protein